MSERLQLTPEAEEVLRGLAAKMRLSEEVVLEAIIREFAPSTIEEFEVQAQSRREALQDFLAQLPLDTDPKKIWLAGFRKGWVQFQYRKLSSIWRIVGIIDRGAYHSIERI